VLGLGPLRTRLQRAAGRGFTKFVGREREMEALRHSAALAREGRGQIVAAMADPGVGKSRLFYEFKATSASGWMVLETLSISHGKASAYLPVTDLLRNYFEISITDDERKRREKVAGKITVLDRSLEDTLPYVFSLLGIVDGDDPLAQTDGRIRKRRTLEAIEQGTLRLDTIAKFVDKPAPGPRSVIATIKRGLDHRQPLAQRARRGRPLWSVFVQLSDHQSPTPGQY
jgi:predicted ATPase